jgi:hypothetical protein
LIAEEVQKHWASKRKALLLSDLGVLLRNECPNLMSAMDGNLLQFLHNSQPVQIVKHPRKDQKIGAVPVGVILPFDLAEIFESRSSSARPRLNPVFWQAFHTPIDGQRFVVIGENDAIRIEHDSSHISQSERKFEILPTDIVNGTFMSLTEKISSTWTKIDAWLARHSLSYDPFIAAEGKNVAPRFKPLSRDFGQVNWQYDLAMALGRLDLVDQARILVPLDILVKMISRR